MMNFEQMTKQVRKLESMALALSVALDNGDASGCGCSDFYPAANELQAQLSELSISMNRALEARSVEMVG